MPPCLVAHLQESYSPAFTEGTRQNHIRQTKAYVTFMMASAFPPLAPTLIQLLLYIQFLANSFKAITTVKNYLSGAKTYILHQGGSVAHFQSPIITNLFKGLARLSTHVPAQAPPLSISDIKSVCDNLARLDDQAQVARTAILKGFATFLRQSNLLYTAGYGACHCMTRRDIQLIEGRLWITVNSSKTISDRGRRVAIPIYPAHTRYCPVKSWSDYVSRMPLPMNFPAFMLSPTIPLTPNRLTAYLRAALSALFHPLTDKVTVHSLRRSGARAVASAGATEEEMMIHGTWTSSAVTTYVPKKLYTKVTQVMAKIFGHK